MDQTDQIDFGNLQKEERFKLLEQSLRNTRLKISARKQTTPWSSCSSINGEPSDLNYTSTTQLTKMDSEILTSSRNLKNLIHKRPNYKPMATSSVKKFSEIEQNASDKAIMPPPSSYMIRTPLKRSAPVDAVPDRIKFRRQATHENDYFPQEKQTHVDLNCKDLSEDLAGPSDSQKEKVDRHFNHWRVFLNDRGELLIKGSLNNEKWARSKPVAGVVSPKTLKSKYQHTYYLHGNIIDDNNELPKYVYQKFYNGFPEDWRNVHEIWKNYVAQGCKESFRWPADVSYSDDDLNSEITDITQIQNKEEKSQELNSMEKSTPQRSSGYSSDFPHETKMTENPESDRNMKNQSVQTNCAESVKESNENRILHESRIQCDSIMDHSYTGNFYTAIKYAYALQDIIFPNKLTIITKNLLSAKCPMEYVQHVTRTFENLKNILSVNMDESDENDLKKSMDPIINFERKSAAPVVLTQSTKIDNEKKSMDPIINFERKSAAPVLLTQTTKIDGIHQDTENNEENNNSKEINEKLMRQIIIDKIVENNESVKNEVIEKLTKKPVNDDQKQSNSNVEQKNNNCKKNQVTCEETDSENEISGVPKKYEKILQSKIYRKQYGRHDKINDTNRKSRIRNITKERQIDSFSDSSVSIIDQEIPQNPSNNQPIKQADSRNLKLKSKFSGSIVNDLTMETRIDQLKENRVIADNKSSSKIDSFNDSSVSIIDQEIPQNPSNNRPIIQADSRNLKLKSKFSGSIVNDLTMETRIDPLRENRVIADNKSSSKIPVFSKASNAMSNENRKSNKENMENDFRRKEINEFPDIVQRKETQNFSASDSNRQGHQQKPTINHIEKVNFNFPKKPMNQFSITEQNRQDSRDPEQQGGKATNSKTTEKRQNPKEKLADRVSNDLSYDTFGSEENPKILKNWTPLVTSVDKKNYLVFEGTLWNAVGTLMKRKYTTSQVLRGNSSIVETVDHQFYKLSGEMNTKKHVVPKELLPHCRTGCPVNIDHFNATWLKLKREGEQVVKDGDAVQKSDNPKKKSVPSSIGSSVKRLKSLEQETANETDKGVLHSAEGQHSHENKVSQKLKFESIISEEETPINTNSRRSYWYELRKRQRVSYEDNDTDDDERYPPISQKETEKPKQPKKVKTPGPTIQITYKRNARIRSFSMSDDQESIA